MIEAGDVSVTPPVSGDANGDFVGNKHLQVQPDDVATPIDSGDATGDARSLAEVLIDNARITAELEGTRELLGELRDDREFLREELREARDGRKDVREIAERMLKTLENDLTWRTARRTYCSIIAAVAGRCRGYSQ